jgi:hypothetical protein
MPHYAYSGFSSSTHHSLTNLLFFGFLVLRALAFGIAEFDQLQFTLHRF